MLHRQKVALEFLRRAKRPVQRIELVKWSFLLSHQCKSGGGSAFFEFLPFHYGPYSFGMAWEMNKMAANGLIAEGVNKTWCLTSAGASQKLNIQDDVLRDINDLLSDFAGLKTKALLDYVYDQYPWYTVNSTTSPRAKRIKAAPKVYTAGYEGLQVDGFLDLLLRSGIEHIVDVRRNPIARRYGFHRGTLSKLAAQVGIDYVHLPELGIASQERQDLDSPGARERLFARYRQTTLSSKTAAIEQVGGLIKDKPSVLICLESDASCCHRSHLAEAVAKLTKLPIAHLKSLH